MTPSEHYALMVALKVLNSILEAGGIMPKSALSEALRQVGSVQTHADLRVAFAALADFLQHEMPTGPADPAWLKGVIQGGKPDDQ